MNNFGSEIFIYTPIDNKIYKVFFFYKKKKFLEYV